MVPGRNLQAYLGGRERVEKEGLGVGSGNGSGNPGIVLSAVYEKNEDFS